MFFEFEERAVKMGKKVISPRCASCELETREKICISDEGSSHKGCPTINRKSLLAEANKEYDDPEVYEFARQSSIQEAECYQNRGQDPYIMQPSKPRIIEICEFSKKMGYRRLGLAFCVGLAKEAQVVDEIFKEHGFEVVSVLCKAGRTQKEIIGISDKEKIRHGSNESMCNPVFQAKLLNQEETDFNILLGLCVGHDSLFFKYAEAPTTVLAVKDRVTGHNPLAAIYLSSSYYRKIHYPGIC